MTVTRRFLTAMLLVAATPAATAESRPNVVLIMVDDLGYQDLGCQGHPSIRTPVLDRLAAEGVRLTDFHSGATVCTPSRMALLTGAYPVRLGWTRGVVGYKMGVKDGMSPDALTIAEIFQASGYATGISGKWHIGNQPDTRPHRQGFDSAYHIPLSNNQTDEIWRADEIVEKPFENRLLTERITDEAVRFIREKKDRPFLLYLPYTAPHFPVEPHPEWKGRSNFGDYGDVVEELDHRIGTLLEAIKELGIEKRTIVVFTSDNGPNPGEKANSLPYRGEKWSALEGGTRVPCIVSWPGTLPAGRVSDKLIGAIDLLPSLSRACGIDWKAQSQGKPKIDGLDIWDTLLGKDLPHPRTELLFWQGMSPEPQAIRVGEWKLFFDRRHALEGMGTKRATLQQNARIEPYRKALVADTANPPMLFNLSDDAGETTDLADQFPDKVKALQARAEGWVAEIKRDPVLPISTPHAGGSLPDH